MKQKNDILLNAPRNTTGSRMRMLNEINLHLKEFSCRNIPLHECLTKTGALSADLIADHYMDSNIPGKIYDSILIMFTNYYVILHIDNFTGNYTVNKEYIFKQALKINEQVIREISKNKKLKSFDLETANLRSLDFIKKLTNIYYQSGIGGCFNYLIYSIHSALVSAGPEYNTDKKKIAKLVRGVQAEKFLNLFHNDINVWR